MCQKALDSSCKDVRLGWKKCFMSGCCWCHQPHQSPHQEAPLSSSVLVKQRRVWGVAGCTVQQSVQGNNMRLFSTVIQRLQMNTIICFSKGPMDKHVHQWNTKFLCTVSTCKSRAKMWYTVTTFITTFSGKKTSYELELMDYTSIKDKIWNHCMTDCLIMWHAHKYKVLVSMNPYNT